MVYRGAGGLCLGDRHLLCDSQHQPEFRFRRMVDSDLERQRLWSLERRHVLYSSVWIIAWGTIIIEEIP